MLNGRVLINLFTEHASPVVGFTLSHIRSRYATACKGSTFISKAQPDDHILQQDRRVSYYHKATFSNCSAIEEAVAIQMARPLDIGLSGLPIESAQDAGCTRTRTAAYHPAANGMVELFHWTLKYSLRAAADPEN
ncbi:unnamed protein product [Dibothriocephalus latus]|uniref:Integrase catalytic domain-containing protein n=1 Tax=Dibothriocephalus latus TaxID=60516 RepID=A0A3P7LEI0_DIBLA|nr:unnamed protein product [Dibothriocephalus latus]